MASHGANAVKETGVDPFTRKSSVKKVVKGNKKQQGSSRFKTKPNVELVQLATLKGIFSLFLKGSKFSSIL